MVVHWGSATAVPSVERLAVELAAATASWLADCSVDVTVEMLVG